MLASVILDEVAELLHDTSNTRWTSAQLVAWLNEAQRAVALVRPDASSTTGNIDLVAGSKQSLPATGLRLLALIRNTGADGATIGNAIRLVERGVLDDYSPDWHLAANQAAVVEEYFYDDRQPKTFWVSPPSSGSVKVEGTYATLPTDCADANASISLDDIYQSALIEWIMYRAWGRFDDPRSAGRSSQHKMTFMELMGVKQQADVAGSPKQRAHLA